MDMLARGALLAEEGVARGDGRGGVLARCVVSAAERLLRREGHDCFGEVRAPGVSGRGRIRLGRALEPVSGYGLGVLHLPR